MSVLAKEILLGLSWGQAYQVGCVNDRIIVTASGTGRVTLLSS